MHHLPETGYVRLSQIIGNPKADPPVPPVIPVCKSTWWAGVKSGRFPAPVKLGPHTTARRVEHIRALIDGRREGATMRHANPTRGRFAFKRDRLPNPAHYYREQGLKLIGGGEWKSAVCPFHDDTHPSLRVRLDTGGFRCMACGAHGGDVLAFHMRRYGLRFVEAAKALGAWEGER